MMLGSSCVRCGATKGAFTMSKFNTETICMACKADEQLAPGYRAANEAEMRAVRAGDYNFPGVGLSAADLDFLAQRRAARTP